MSTNIFPNEEKKQLTRLNLPKKNYFLYVGRVSRDKSLDILLRSFAEFSHSNNNIDLLIVGDGPAKNELRRLVNNLKIGRRIHFLGMIDRHKLLTSNLYTNALAFVTTSKSETQCISVLEAMSFGLPIVAVAQRALPELIKNNGILCQPDNIKNITEALHKIADNSAQRNLFSQASLQLVKKHSLKATVEKLEDIYQKLINSSPARSTFF